MRPSWARPHGEREVIWLARIAVTVGYLMLSTTPIVIEAQVATATADHQIDPITTAALPTTTANEALATAPSNSDQRAFLFATGNLPSTELMPPPPLEGALNVVLAARPVIEPDLAATQVAEAPRPHPEALADFDPTAPIAYADPGGTEDIEAPFRALINPLAKPEIEIAWPDPVTDHDWVANSIPLSARSAQEKRCLAEAIYFEARSEPIRGQLAVAQVVVNRLKNPAYPDTVCGVVYQNQHWLNACQFSFACDRIREVVRDAPAWNTAQELARAVLDGEAIWVEEVGSATHYHANYVRLNWAGQIQRMAQIGLHVFYRTYGGGWI